MRDVDGRVQKLRVDVSWVHGLLSYLDTTPGNEPIAVSTDGASVDPFSAPPASAAPRSAPPAVRPYSGPPSVVPPASPIPGPVE